MFIISGNFTWWIFVQFSFQQYFEDDPWSPRFVANRNQHMPYCPKNPDFRQYIEDVRSESQSQLSYLESYVSRRLKQNSNMSLIYPVGETMDEFVKMNSSWPTLAWSADNIDKLSQLDRNSLDWTDEEDECSDLSSESSECLSTGRSTVFSVWQCLVQFWYCFTANEKYKQEMRKRRTPNHDGFTAVNSVSKIDKVSRICFPLIFFVINVAYWSFYINERNADFNQWE